MAGSKDRQETSPSRTVAEAIRLRAEKLRPGLSVVTTRIQSSKIDFSMTKLSGSCEFVSIPLAHRIIRGWRDVHAIQVPGITNSDITPRMMWRGSHPCPRKWRRITNSSIPLQLSKLRLNWIFRSTGKILRLRKQLNCSTEAAALARPSCILKFQQHPADHLAVRAAGAHRVATVPEGGVPKECDASNRITDRTSAALTALITGGRDATEGGVRRQMLFELLPAEGTEAGRSHLSARILSWDIRIRAGHTRSTRRSQE